MLHLGCANFRTSTRAHSINRYCTGILYTGKLAVVARFVNIDKRHRGEPGHTSDKRDTRTHGSDEPHNHPSQVTSTKIPSSRPTNAHTRTTARRARSRPSLRSSPNHAADSEKTTPSEVPDPAECRLPLPERLPAGAAPASCSCARKRSRRNEGARSSRCVAAGGAARTPNELESREAEAGVCHGGEASLKLG